MPTNPLLDSLQAVRRKVKTLSVLFGVGVAVATAVGLLLGVLLVDYLFGLDKGPRLLLILGALVLLVYIVYQRIIVPARSKLKVGDLAGRIEHTFPQFDDRLRSTVDFTQQDIPGSVAMKERVVREAGELAQSVRFERVIIRKPVYLSLGGALLALVILGLLAVWGSQTGVLDIALNRLAMGSEAWPKTVEIAMVNKLPARIAAGQHIPVRIRLAKGDRDSRRATIYYRYDNGPWEQEIMSRQDGQYVATLDARLEQGKTNAKLDVRLEAGDDEKELSPIAVVPRLELTRITADITPPEYVRQATPTRVNLIERPAIAAVGSDIAIAVQFNKPLDPKSPVEILPVKEGATAPSVKWDRTSSDVAVAHFQAAQSLRFAVKATDEDGFQSAAGEEYELSVREDQPPTVQIEEPKRSEERTPNAAFDIKAVAEDDYGIVGAQLVVHRLNDQGKNATDKNQWLVDLVENGQPVATDSALTWELVDNNPEHKRYRLVYNWQLEHLAGANLKPGDMLEYYLQVKDNFALNGHQHDWVPSGRLRITIISADQFATIVQNQLEQIQQAINTTRLEQIRHKNETDMLRQGVDRNRKFDAADRAIASRLANDQSSTASQTMNIAQKLQELRQTMNENKSPEGGPKQLAADVQQQLQQTADGPMRTASNDLNATKEQPLVDQPNQQKPGDQQPNDGQQKNNNPSTPSNNANNQGKNQNSQQNNRSSANPDQKNSASNQPSDKNQQTGNQSGKNNPSDQKPQDSNQQANNSQNKSTPAQAQDAQQRSSAMANASQKQQQAADQLQQAMDKLGQMGGVSEAIQKLEKIRADQEKLENQFREANKNNIGKRNEDLSKEDQDKNKKMSDEQRKQAGDLQQTMKNMEKKAEQMSKSDPQASQAMKQASQMAQQQNLNSKQQQAADSMQQNQQAQAQQNQQQVELGLDVILARLKEAERRRLEELARQLESLQQLVNDLVVRQGGHNIDNLRLQGGDKRLAQLDPKERDELFDFADRDPQKMPPVPQLPSLTASQEQTERNARDIGKQAESLPDPTPSAKIIQAAESMERAIVHLRGNQLPDAYDPPQVEALHALADAQKQIDAALKQARQQLEKQDAESLKQSYVKLLQKQKAVGQQIVQVDKTPKENGDLPRDVAIKLGQLPGDQGKLIDDAKGLGEKLKQLDSIVYNWANNDIIKSMGTVKDNLAKPQTGQPTQLAEQHVEEQLQDMIDSLVRKIDKKEFNSRENNGQQQNGKPGQNKPKLPSEAELRLLRKNQEAINKGTIDADKQAQKDKERVLDLGTRQGSMRDLLDQLIQRASEGKMKLGPEPDNRDQLPEEAKKQDVDDQELTKDLLGNNPSDDADANKIKLTGDRMARSRQRLALNDDPGAVTQEIQKRIVIDIDDLIKAAQAQQARMESRPGQQRQRQRMQQAQRQQQQQQQQTAQNQQHREDGTQAATVSRLDQGSDPKADLSQDLQQKLGEWGRITARDRQAVEQTAGEQEIGKYKNLIHDYYKSLAEQASKH